MPRDAITARISGVHIYLLCPRQRTRIQRHDPTRQRDAPRLIDRSLIIIGIDEIPSSRPCPLAEAMRYATALIEVAAMGSREGVPARGWGQSERAHKSAISKQIKTSGRCAIRADKSHSSWFSYANSSSRNGPAHMPAYSPCT